MKSPWLLLPLAWMACKSSPLPQTSLLDASEKKSGLLKSATNECVEANSSGTLATLPCVAINPKQRWSLSQGFLKNDYNQKVSFKAFTSPLKLTLFDGNPVVVMLQPSTNAPYLSLNLNKPQKEFVPFSFEDQVLIQSEKVYQTTFNKKTYHVRLKKVEDSRCPEGVYCLWQGAVEFHWHLKEKGKKESKIQKEVALVSGVTELPCLLYSKGDPFATVIHGFKGPVPKVGEKAPLKDYRLELAFKRMKNTAENLPECGP